MCKCKNIEIGSYDNQVMLPRPDHMKGRKEGTDNNMICIDRCLEEEIKFLWKNGVFTAGCCCGHNKLQPMINVADESFDKMEELGYTFSLNRFGTRDYKPKRINL